MTHCWLCGASEIKSPNSKYTYYGKILGKRVQKTIRVCNCCSAMRADEDIREEVAEMQKNEKFAKAIRVHEKYWG